MKFPVSVLLVAGLALLVYLNSRPALAQQPAPGGIRG